MSSALGDYSSLLSLLKVLLTKHRVAKPYTCPRLEINFVAVG